MSTPRQAPCVDHRRFFVGPSVIPGAGGGLFAAVDLRRGECIGRYEGHRISAAEALHPDRTRGYLMANGSYHIDARDPAGRLVLADGSIVDVHGWKDAEWSKNVTREGRRRGVEWRGVANLTRFINSGSTQYPTNCTLTRNCRGGIGFRAKRDIRAGEELLGSYGGSYWQSSNDDTCAKCLLRGFLIECDGCNRSYHLGCAGLKRRSDLPKGDWYCPVCRKRSSGAATANASSNKSRTSIKKASSRKASDCAPCSRGPAVKKKRAT